MASKVILRQQKSFTVVVLLACLACGVICETGDCGQQEFRDQSGSCVLCKQCGPGMELSKECGFGYGEDAQCVKCRPHRFKEDWGSQKCKPCLDCALLSRFQKANCSATGDAVCGDCLPGFYRKTKLVGFQDMECVPCGDPPPPYEPHWSHHQLSIINVNTSPERLTTLHCWLVIGNCGSNSRYCVLPRMPCCLRAVPSHPVDPLLADVIHSMLTFSCIICFTVHHLRKTLKVQLRRGAESLFAM